MRAERSIVPRKGASCLSPRSSCIRVRIPRLTHNTATIPHPPRNSPVKIARDLSALAVKELHPRTDGVRIRADVFDEGALEPCVTVSRIRRSAWIRSLPRQPRPPHLRPLLCHPPLASVLFLTLRCVTRGALRMEKKWRKRKKKRDKKVSAYKYIVPTPCFSMYLFSFFFLHRVLLLLLSLLSYYYYYCYYYDYYRYNYCCYC